MRRSTFTQGRGAAALSTAAIGSFIAGTIGTLLLTFLAPVFVKLALRFGHTEVAELLRDARRQGAARQQVLAAHSSY